MGLTQNLGRLSPSIFSDSSLNIGVGAAPSGSYKFEVTGTSKVSGVLTLGSTLSNGTYTYTLPAATGTLALVGGAGVGTVTSVAALTIGTTGTDLSSSVATSTTTPVITLNVPTASAANRGALSSADWTTFNNKQGTITLTTTGTSGAATFSSNTLNIPNYGSALSGYVTLTTNQTISGVKTFSSMPILSAASGVNGQIVYADATNTLKTITNFKYDDATGVLTTQLGNLGSNAYTSTAYLPLTGGTLTGALSGTSASFSGNGQFGNASTNTITINANTGNPNIEINGGIGSASIGASSYLRLRDATNSKSSFLQINANGGLDYWFQYGGVFYNRITFENTGAATFSSSVTAGTQFNAFNDRNYLARGSFRLTSSSNNASTLDISVTDSTTNIYSNYFSGGNDNTLIIGTYAYNSNQLVLKPTGNILIGTTTDDTVNKLQVNGSAAINGTLKFKDFITPSANYFEAYTYNDNTFRLNYNGAGNDELILSNTGDLTILGYIKTANPSGGTAQTWKLGGFTSGTFAQGGKVRVEINGVAYDLLTT